MKCPSCIQSNISQVEQIKSSFLVSLYKKRIDIDISYLLQEKFINYQHCKECDLFFFDPPLTGDQRFYEELQKFDWYYLNEKSEYHYAKQFVTANNSVLEIGSGSGFFTDFISPKGYVGLEFNDVAIQQAVNRGIKVLSESVEAHAVKYSDTYDVVCSFQVLEHVAEINSFIASALKCVKPGGLLIIAVPNHDSFLRYCYNGILNLPPHHVSHWSINALTHLSDIHNIELVDIYQEKMDTIHEQWFFETLFFKAVTDWFRYPLHIVDCSLQGKLFAILAALLSKCIKRPLPQNILPVGHTVCAVYKK
jgi:2-polyprenyl-3-methyl-5-hydroxy-6-metoxy-1,4-benzoquinol methylase